MEITKIEPIEGQKRKIYLDGEYAFSLYIKEIARFHFTEGMVLSDEEYDKIMKETVYRRAKQKAMMLLRHTDQTEHELCRKLKQAGYSENAAQEALDYVKKFDYLDDLRYACSFIHLKQNLKSRQQMFNALYQKGISKEIVQKAYEQETGSGTGENAGFEDEALDCALRKKCRNVKELSSEERQKLAASLYRKGFRMEDIRRRLSAEEEFS